MHNLTPLIIAIKKQTNKETIVVVLLTTIVFSMTLCFFLYQNYFSTPNKMISIEAGNISRSIIDGDSYSIRNEISILSNRGGFDAIWLVDKNGFLISQTESKSEEIIKKYQNKIGFTYQNSKFFIIHKYTLPNTDNTNLFSSQIINIFGIFITYLFLIFMILIISIFIKKSRFRNYSLFIEPILTLTKHIENISENKNIIEVSNENKFCELHLLYEKINFFIRSLAENEQAKMKLAELSGMTNSVRMLAHDIRKPFSILNAGLFILDKMDNIDTFKQESVKLKIELTRNLTRVTSMLNDFMNLGTQDVIPNENILFEEVLSDVLFHSFYIDENSDIEFKYNFHHKNKIRFIKIKLERILNNLVTNALEAMNSNGVIEFTSKNITIARNHYIQFSIKNSNSYIPKEYLDKIFQLKFTMGKKGGNGIGLFSVKNLLEEAGGSITCTADKKNGVEFIFTIPAREEIFLPDITNHIFLPASSHEIIQNREKNYKKSFKNNPPNDFFKLKNYFLTNKTTILLIDDETNYLRSIRECFNVLFPNAEDIFHFIYANKYQEALTLYEKNKPNIVICDIDLNDSLNDGFHIIEHIQNSNKQSYLCIHTNRILTDKQITKLKIDKYIPKPLDENNLFHLLSDYLEEK